MSECTHNCSSCGQDCSSRTKESMLEPLGEGSSVKKVIGIVSGKGGVGKSLVTSMLAINSRRAGYRSAVLDADITGPSIPQGFGIHEKAYGVDNMIIPATSRTGIDVMSINLLLEHETDPVAWRGAMIASAVKQFWGDVIWKDVDFMYVDMPPGTGDVPLTVFQSIPVDGIIIVTSPQDLVSMIVAKAVGMAGMMNIPILGIVENMSYFKCPDCGKIHEIYGESKIDAVADQYGILNKGRLPIDPAIASLVDNGLIEDYTGDYLDEISAAIHKLV